MNRYTMMNDAASIKLNKIGPQFFEMKLKSMEIISRIQLWLSINFILLPVLKKGKPCRIDHKRQHQFQHRSDQTLGFDQKVLKILNDDHRGRQLFDFPFLKIVTETVPPLSKNGRKLLMETGLGIWKISKTVKTQQKLNLDQQRRQYQHSSSRDRDLHRGLVLCDHKRLKLFKRRPIKSLVQVQLVRLGHQKFQWRETFPKPLLRSQNGQRQQCEEAQSLLELKIDLQLLRSPSARLQI